LSYKQIPMLSSSEASISVTLLTSISSGNQ
jgi:hypothetical protein